MPTIQRTALSAVAASRLIAGMVAAVGLLVLFGWTVGSVHLKRVVPGLVAMNPVVAVCFILAGGSLALLAPVQPSRRAKRLGVALAFLITAIALLKLVDYAMGSDAGVDQLLFFEELAIGAGPPNRMAPNTALNFLLLGVALSLLRSPLRVPGSSQGLTLLAALVAYLALMGYAYLAGSFTRVSNFIPMALHSACTFLLLCVGVLVAASDRGVLGIITRKSPGGRLLRRLVPIIVGVPPVLGWVRLQGEIAGIFGASTGVVLMVGTMVVMGISLAFWNALSADVRERERLSADEAIQRLAYFDSLTGLPNRPLFYDRLNRALAHATRHQRSMALLYLDLDHFKTINDTLGHAAGDKLLAEAARRLQTCVRNSDTVARLGGDEFTAILAEVSSVEGVRGVAERILKELARAFIIDGREVNVSASIGVALAPMDGHVSDELLKRADEALYRAKSKRNHCEFYSDAVLLSAKEEAPSRLAMPANSAHFEKG